MAFVSIIMRSMNDIAYIEQTLSMIEAQSYDNYELINVDCSSIDGTYEIIKKHNKRTHYQIRPEEYLPGRVLNEAVSRCRGELIVFNNSDCIPRNREWLAELVKPLLEDEGVGAVYGCQVPRPDARPLVRKDYERAFGDGRIASGWEHFFSLATSAARRETLLAHPFDSEIRYSEDIEWSRRLIGEGYRLVYAKDAVVEHSHNYSFSQLKSRFYGEGRAEALIYGESPRRRSLISNFLKPYAAEVVRDIIYLAARLELHFIPYSFIYRFIQKYSLYRGYKDYFAPFRAGKEGK